jgi:hypothetical protein
MGASCFLQLPHPTHSAFVVCGYPPFSEFHDNDCKKKLYWHAVNVTDIDSFNKQGNLCTYIVTFVMLSRNYRCSGNATVHYAR